MDKVFLQAIAGEPTPHTPIWLNRQAGRYMPEYHRVKGDTPSLDFFKNPVLAAKATLDAQRILGENVISQKIFRLLCVAHCRGISQCICFAYLSGYL